MTSSEAAGVDVSVITVTFNSGRYVGRALGAAKRAADAAGLRCEFIVVDNASSDDSVAAVEAVVPDARVIRNAANRGFGAANNQAFAHARGLHWLLLNPDATVEAATLVELVRHLDEHPNVGAVAPTIRGPGTSAESAGMAPSLRSAIGHFLFVNRLPGMRGAWAGLQLRRRRDGRPVAVEWASAAVLLLRPAAVRAVGGFDETIFLYAEDIELCRRLRAAGWRVVLDPEALADHAIGHDEPSTRWVDGLHALYARDADRVRLVAFDAVVALGLAIRAWATCRDPGSVHHRRLARSARRAAELALASAGVGKRGWSGATVPRGDGGWDREG